MGRTWTQLISILDWKEIKLWKQPIHYSWFDELADQFGIHAEALTYVMYYLSFLCASPVILPKLVIEGVLVLLSLFFQSVIVVKACPLIDHYNFLNIIALIVSAHVPDVVVNEASDLL